MHTSQPRRQSLNQRRTMGQDYSQTQMSLAKCWASTRGILCVESTLTSRNTLIKELSLKVPFAKPYFSESDIETILSGMRAVLESGWLTSGKNVEAFEQEFAELIGTKY